jgi:hypothetical protein
MNDRSIACQAPPAERLRVPAYEPTKLRVDLTTGQVLMRMDEAVPVPSDWLWAVEPHGFESGYVLFDKDGREWGRELVNLSSGLPVPVPDFGFVEYGQTGPRPALRLTMWSLEEAGFPAVYTATGRHAQGEIWRLVNEVLEQFNRPAGQAGFVCPVVRIRPRSFLAPNKRDCFYFSWELVDWLHSDGARRQSEDVEHGPALVVQAGDEPVPLFRDVVEQLIDGGWQPIPEAGTSKVPAKRGWLKPRTAKVWLRALRRDRRLLYTGLATNDIIGLDLDVEDAFLARELMALAFTMLGSTPCRFGRAPRVLLPFRVMEPMPSSALHFELDGAQHAIEIKGKNQKFTALALHQKTRRPYRWDCSPLDIPRASLPLVTPEALHAYHRAAVPLITRAGGTVGAISGGGGAAKPRPTSARKPSIDEVAYTLRRIPNSGDGQPYDIWVRVGLAVKATLGAKAGEPLWLWWSGQSSKDRPEVTGDLWVTCDPKKIGFGSLVYLARTLG